MESFFDYLSSDRKRLPKVTTPSTEELRGVVEEYAPWAFPYITQCKTAENGFWKVVFRVPLEKLEDAVGGIVDDHWAAESLARSIPGGFHSQFRFLDLKAVELTVVGRSNSNAQFSF